MLFVTDRAANPAEELFPKNQTRRFTYFVTYKELSEMFRTILTLLAATILFPVPGRAQSVDEVIAKNIQAHGGLERLKSVTTMRASGKFRAGSFRAAFLQENKRPDKVREEFILQGLAQVRAYDGKAGWQVDPFGGRKDPELLAEDDMKNLVVEADIDGPLVDYQQKGHKAELMGHDSVEGTDCYKIKLTLKNADLRYYYLDADSFLELKLETQTMVRGAIKERETYYGDYEKVGGIYYPFAIETSAKGNPDRVMLTVEKIEINVPLSDNLFSMPTTRPGPKNQ